MKADVTLEKTAHVGALKRRSTRSRKGVRAGGGGTGSSRGTGGEKRPTPLSLRDPEGQGAATRLH